MASVLAGLDAKIERVEVSAYTIPTDAPEADGTYSWNSTTLILVEAAANGQTGLGYTYADSATARLIDELLAPTVQQHNPMDVQEAWLAMRHAVRNLGRPGIAAMAISAVDVALWDLKARILDVSLVSLLGAARTGAPIYGSGGFTSYPLEHLQNQLAGWVAQGIPRVKMKIGSEPGSDVRRVRAARQAIGHGTQLFVDANGAYGRKQALAFAENFADIGVTWFEEPVPAEDFRGLRWLRDRSPAGMDIASGEYGYELDYFRRMLTMGAVDVLQADATRCGGITGFLQAAALCQAFHVPLSAHCAPTLHISPCCAAPVFRHLEYFHDHVRIEEMLFEGVPAPVDGILYPDRSRPGLGLDFKHQDAERFLAWKR